MKRKKIIIYKNRNPYSAKTEEELLKILKSYDAEVLTDTSAQPDLYICIGGDGSFLNFAHKFRFPKAPVLGINTGHLGFFQECDPTNMKKAIAEIFDGNYQVQKIRPIEASIFNRNKLISRKFGINEIMVRGSYAHVSQFAVSVGETKIQDFSGDGILISTPVGSTAYNYSLGGSLVAPELDVLQITPVAPMNTAAYRAFHSSMVLPADQTITINGIGRTNNRTLIISFDGKTSEFYDIDRILIRQSNLQINLIRSVTYDYWKKLADKLL